MKTDYYPAAFARLVAKVDELRAENERLREALAKLTEQQDRAKVVMRRPKGAERRERPADDVGNGWKPGPCRPGSIV